MRNQKKQKKTKRNPIKQVRNELKPKFSLLLLFLRSWSASASIFSPTSAWPWDQSDFILPNTSVPPLTKAPPKRCNLFSLLSRDLTLLIDWVGEAFERSADSELVDEFIEDRPEKFLWKNASRIERRCYLTVLEQLDDQLTGKCVVLILSSASAIAAVLVDAERTPQMLGNEEPSTVLWRRSTNLSLRHDSVRTQIHEATQMRQRVLRTFRWLALQYLRRWLEK